MPFTVITLKKVPDSLRGDLTRWMQEVATGVYVGNFNAKVRDFLWKRVTDTIGQGEAIICYSCRNEIGYSFRTCNSERQVLDYDGIPLVLIPETEYSDETIREKKYGFSNASKYHQAKRRVSGRASSEIPAEPDQKAASTLAFLDIETTGLDAENDQIIEIGAIKVEGEREIEFHRLIRIDSHLPENVSELTGITGEMLTNGTLLEASIRELDAFIRGTVLVGYNVSFDIRFINRALERFAMEPIHNKTFELMHEAKKRNSFQANYKFETTLKEYGINQKVLHRALEDAKLMLQLYKKWGYNLAGF